MIHLYSESLNFLEELILSMKKAVIKPKKRIKRVPNTDSKNFPRIFTLMGNLVGFRKKGKLHAQHGYLSIYLVPVGRRPESWALFEKAPDKSRNPNDGPKYEDKLTGLASTFHRPILANGSIRVKRWFWERGDVPKELKSLAEGQKVAELDYRILSRYWNEQTLSLEGRKIGTEMVRYLEEEARKAGVKVLTASVTENTDSSHALMRKMGFIRSKEPILPEYNMKIYLYYKLL